MEEGSSIARNIGTRSTVALVMMVTISFLLLLLLLAPSSMAQDVTWGDKVVYGSETHSDLNLTLDGNLTVADGGYLALDSVDMIVNATKAGQFRLVVDQGGRLVLTNVTIASAGGTFGIEIHGMLNFTEGSLTGLDAEDHNKIVPRGFVVDGIGAVNLTDVDVSNPLGHALVLNDTALVWVNGGSLFGSSIVVRINEDGQLVLDGVDVSADRGTELVMMSATGLLIARDSSFRSNQVYSSSVHSVAVHLLGDGNEAFFHRCQITTAELAIANGGYLEMVGTTFDPHRVRGIPDLNVRDASVIIEDISMVELMAFNTRIELRMSTFTSGEVTNGSTVYSYGPVPPIGLMANDTVIHHHYWVDFVLLNRTGDPEEGLVLTVETSLGALVVNEARSDAEGLVSRVPVRSWTIDGQLFTYESSHRVEFGETSYQITNLQIYGNTTVTLWDMVGSYDLVLNTASVTPSIPAPEENRTFNIVVDGKVLVPKTWGTGSGVAVLYVDDVEHGRVTFTLSSRDDVVFRDLDVEAGTHIFRVVVDPDGTVDEINEGGNNEVRFLLDVAPEGGTGDLVDLTIEIDRVGDTAGNSGEVLVPGIIYVDYTVRAFNSKLILRNVLVAVYVDDDMDDLVRVDLTMQEGEAFAFSGQFRLNLARGDYVIKVVVDPNNEIDEEREYNNEDLVSVTLTEDPGTDGFFDQECCISIVVMGLVAAVGLIGAWAQRKQRLAAAGGAPARFEGVTQPSMPGTQSSMPGAQPYMQQPVYQSGGISAGQDPVSLDESWRVEQSSGAYTADGWEEGVAERIIAPSGRAPPARDRYKAADLTCPRCNGRDIIGFSDGSAKCQSCKKIFYPGRR